MPQKILLQTSHTSSSKMQDSIQTSR